MISTPRYPTMAATLLLSVLVLMGCREQSWGPIAVSPSLEDITPDSSLYTPSTQSFLRGDHWLETVENIELLTDGLEELRIDFEAPGSDAFLSVVQLPTDYLVPRLTYPAADPPDAFDAFNLMMAEYSRNSVSVPVGSPGDATAHFQTNLAEEVPWKLVSDYQFEPNPQLRPIRIGVINNCLTPGLWELNASDRSGEIYHSWFNMPEALYTALVARANGVDEAFAAQATQWDTEPAEIDFARLRTVDETIGRTTLRLSDDADAGYSSQDSRRKLAKRYALVEKEDALVIPEHLSDLTASPVHLSSFIEPGKYAFTERRVFDLAFLAATDDAEIRRVTPLTDYDWLNRAGAEPPPERAANYLELTLHLDEYNVVLGNLPMELLVPQEDFVIEGFGVGVLNSAGIAERRKYLYEQGPAPSFAYLYQMQNGRAMALNSHEFGIEQIFIRTHTRDDDPWWEITITSYERIVDLVKYRVDIPEALQQELTTYAMEYISPLYRTYRDDNLR